MTPEELAAAYATRRLAEVHRAAQEKLGLSAGLVAFGAFAEANVLNPTLNAEWYARIVSVTQALRRISRTLAGRYYNLARAIESGYTYPDIDYAHDDSNPIPLSKLYEEMGEVLNEIINLTDPGVDDIPSDDLDSDVTGSREDRLDELDDLIADVFTELLPEEDSDQWSSEIDVESWDWDEEDPADFDTLEDFIRQQADELAKRAQVIMDDDETNGPDRLRTEIDTLSNKVAAQADRTAMKVGRDLLDATRVKDGRVRAFFRITGPNPCAFCSMLASRGAVYYSEQSATTRSRDNELYHDNCHCETVAVWLKRPWYSDRDVYFIRNWKKVTDGQSGKDALNAWRRWLYDQYKSNAVPPQDNFGRPS